MKNIKEMIIPILLGFTLGVSVYSSVKVIQNEKECLPYNVCNNGINNNSSKVFAIDLIK